MPTGQIPAQGQRLALGGIFTGHQCGHVCFAAVTVQRQRASGIARTLHPWLQAFAWIRQNTPTDAYFALNPEYLAAPGEDYHSFRALAERSQLADTIKDGSVVTQIPELGEVWERQVQAQKGWTRFQLADFQRLKAEFGVAWVLVAYPQPAGLACQWHNDALSVCRVP